MDNSDIADSRFGCEVKIFHLQIIHPVRVRAYEKHRGKQDFQSISLVQTDEDFQKILCVVSAHTEAFGSKDNSYQTKKLSLPAN